MTKQEVADLLKVSLRTVSRLIEKGELPYHKMERTVRIRREDVEAYLDKIRKE